MILLLLAVIYNFSMLSSQEDCARGNHSLARFGPTCEYLCHCGTFQCDMVTGVCPNNSECDGGWMGSGCQYVNIAYNATVSSNHLSNTATIVDGRSDSCPYETQPIINPAYVIVSFLREVKITEVNIVFSTSGRNLAYGKPAIQSSLEYIYYASNAVDGVTYNDSPWLTCTHTLESTDPWWLLDLQSPIMIQWFQIFNRPDSGGYFNFNERLRNFRILLSQDNVTFNTFYQDQNNGPNDPPLVIEPSLNPDVLARFVKIDLQGTNRILSLCEVQVFGECVPGYYGGNCDKSCFNCKNVACDKITGRCQSCVAGKYGDLCQIECDLFFYGNCSTPCGYCAVRESCNKANGSCDVDGCASGWQSENCDIPCADNYYGNCSTRCGHCKDSSVCNKVDGSCASGLCSEGWKGDTCNIECSSTYYGLNCEEPCGYCVNNTCDRLTGYCSENGCEPGWQGSRCDIILIAKNFQQQPVTDTNVVAIGSSVGAAVAIAVIIITVVICITIKRRRKRNTMERNTKIMEMSPNSSNLAGINTDGPIQTLDNATIEHPRTYYNIEDLNENERGSTNITSNNATVEFDVNLYSHYEKLKHHKGAAESAYSSIDHSQSGRHKELLLGASLDESNAYYNIEQ